MLFAEQKLLTFCQTANSDTGIRHQWRAIIATDAFTLHLLIRYLNKNITKSDVVIFFSTHFFSWHSLIFLSVSYSLTTNNASTHKLCLHWENIKRHEEGSLYQKKYTHLTWTSPKSLFKTVLDSELKNTWISLERVVEGTLRKKQ